MLDFCGLGNACIDIVVDVDEAFIKRLALPKGICTYLTDDRAEEVDSALVNPVFEPGGCAANTSVMVTALGGSAAFMGRVAEDTIGKLFITSMADADVLFEPDLAPMEGRGSTRVYTFITDDADRTFATYYGEQEMLSVQDLNERAIREAKYLYLDGYALHSEHNRETFLTAIDWVHEAGGQAVFNPCDVSILNQYKALCEKLMRSVDIIICNDVEAMLITGADTAEKAVQHLQPRFARGAVTSGPGGAIAFDPHHTTRLPAVVPDQPIIDTNGAGDAFAGGYIYGLSQGFNDARAARLGILCASRIITQTGARPKRSFTDLIARV